MWTVCRDGRDFATTVVKAENLKMRQRNSCLLYISVCQWIYTMVLLRAFLPNQEWTWQYPNNACNKCDSRDVSWQHKRTSSSVFLGQAKRQVNRDTTHGNDTALMGTEYACHVEVLGGNLWATNARTWQRSYCEYLLCRRWGCREGLHGSSNLSAQFMDNK